MKKWLAIACLSLMFSISFASSVRHTEKREITKENTILMPSIVVSQIQMDVNAAPDFNFVTEMPNVTPLVCPVDVGKSFEPQLYFNTNRRSYNYRNTLTYIFNKELPIKYSKQSVIPIAYKTIKVFHLYNYRC